jgi:4-hydroxy-3-methylbut-2-enyl diphosphate reductase
VDLVIVLGSPTSANGRRLAEVARAAGVRAELLEDADAVRDFADAGGLDGVGSIGVTAAASTPEDIVDEVMALLRAQI